MPGGSLSFGVGATNHAHFRAVTGDTAGPSEVRGQGAFTPQKFRLVNPIQINVVDPARALEELKDKILSLWPRPWLSFLSENMITML